MHEIKENKMKLICNNTKHNALTGELIIKVRNLMREKIEEGNGEEINEYVKSNFILNLLPR